MKWPGAMTRIKDQPRPSIKSFYFVSRGYEFFISSTTFALRELNLICEKVYDQMNCARAQYNKSTYKSKVLCNQNFSLKFLAMLKKNLQS
jgi:hypothetical protein